MTGPGHYREAELALSVMGTELYANARPASLKGFGPDSLMGIAQVHATLALAAAVAAAPELGAGHWLPVLGPPDAGGVS